MLYETVFRSEDVAPADRFDRWCQHISRSLWPTEMVTDHVSDFRASQRILNLGAVRLCTTEHLPMTVRWTEHLIRQSDPGLYMVTLLLHGSLRVARPGCETAYAAYDLAVHDSSRAACIQTTETGDCDRDKVSEVSALVPKALLPFPGGNADRMITRPMSGRAGMGALFAGFVTRLAKDTSSYQPSDGPRLGTVLIDLMSGLFAHALDGESRLAPEIHRRALTLRIQAFIQQHLRNRHLTPGAVAAAHHISLSYLHRLFQEQGATVSRWIRRQRLERARRDLADPTLRTTPIHAIAIHWGFSHAADFSRAFRTAYGVPPKEYRSGALEAPWWKLR